MSESSPLGCLSTLRQEKTVSLIRRRAEAEGIPAVADNATRMRTGLQGKTIEPRKLDNRADHRTFTCVTQPQGWRVKDSWQRRNTQEPLYRCHPSRSPANFLPFSVSERGPNHVLHHLVPCLDMKQTQTVEEDTVDPEHSRCVKACQRTRAYLRTYSETHAPTRCRRRVARSGSKHS